VSPGARRLPLGALQWFGLLGAPLAWVTQFLIGLSFQFAQCNAAGSAWTMPVHGWAIAALAGAALIGVLGLASAAVLYRAISAAGEDEVPHAARLRFMSILGLTISSLFIWLILMSGLGATFTDRCVQS
jgi:hypothetical protein